MSGHNTKTTTSNFLAKLAAGLKGVTPYYSQLQTAAKPWFQMQSIAFAIIFFVKELFAQWRMVLYGNIAERFTLHKSNKP